MASNSKSRQPRLRASCDGCFLAKVKCSKARPICSRCLACGIVCHYSPSSRAGKPKSDHSLNAHTNAHHRDLHHLNTYMDEKSMAYSSLQQPPPAPDPIFPLETGWSTPPTSAEGSMSRNSSLSSGISFLDVNDGTPVDHEQLSGPSDLYSAAMPWTPPTDIPCTMFPEGPVAAAHMQGSHVRSHSFDAAMGIPISWADPGMSHGLVSYSQMATPVSATANYFPNSTPTSMRSTLSHQSDSAVMASPGACACFVSCLQSLQALHNASAPNHPPFDLVLSINRKAADGCAAMLSCNMCLRQSGTQTATMLLATIIGKVTSFYKSATRSNFGSDNFQMMENGGGGMANKNTFGVHFGTYQLDGEDGKWFQLEILSRELRKLEEIYVKFCDVCAEHSDDPDFARAMIGYLGHGLSLALEVINYRKGDTGFVTQEHIDMKNML